jgi:hypothetical protein
MTMIEQSGSDPVVPIAVFTIIAIEVVKHAYFTLAALAAVGVFLTGVAAIWFIQGRVT